MPRFHVYSYEIANRGVDPVEVWPRQHLGHRGSLAAAQAFACTRCRTDQGLPANIVEISERGQQQGRFAAHIAPDGVTAVTAFTLDLTVLQRS